ncbi:hypothetical protein L1049_009000 [Liquidambar formosana]|uniref:DUF7138 domain-containing protein n=1 Tax=Liquidambar formosana TaxID=63359 RepID=A0AAP0SAA7_LIQFO
MMENPTGVSFPVVFFDGEREINIGNVGVHPSLEFKNFQSILSQKIGISPHQISVYLADRKKSKSPENRRRIPITGKVNFSAIVRERDCFFLVVLKRSRRERRRKHEQSLRENYDYPSFSMRAEQSEVPEKMILLRRNSELTNQPFSGFISPYYDQIAASEYLEYSNRIRELRAQRERYLMVSSPNSNPYSRPDENYAVNTMNDAASDDGIVCEECLVAKMKGRPVGFHWCVYDAVTVGFRSPVGPIARPAKGSY